MWSTSNVRVVMATQLRRQLAGVLTVALVIGVLFGGALAAGAGARRSNSAVARFLAYTQPEDATVNAADESFDMSAVDRLPQVHASGAGGFLFLAPLDATGEPQLDRIAEIAPLVFVPKKGSADDTGRWRIIAGRSPDPTRAEEVLIDEEVAAKRGLTVGSTLRMKAFSPEQVNLTTFDGSNAPEGPELDLVVAGIGRNPSDLDPQTQDPDLIYQGSAEVYLGPAFWARYHDEVAVAQPLDTFRVVRFEHGAADRDAFAAAVRALPGGSDVEMQFGTSDAVKAGEQADSAVALETGSLVALAVVLGVSGLALGAFALSRLVDRAAEPLGALRAIGVPPGTLLVVAAGPAAVSATTGVVVALVVAVVASPRFPVGVARDAEIDVGYHFDSLVLVPGAILALVALLTVALVVAGRARHRLVATVPPRDQVSLADRLAGIGAPFGAVVGTQLAVGRDPRTRRGPVRTAIAIGAIGATAIAAVATFTTSLDSLTDRPASFGWAWDLRLGNPNDSAFTPEAQAAVEDDPNIAGHSSVADPSAIATVAGRDLAIVGLDVNDDIAPPLLAGRQAAAAGEAVLGHDSLAALKLRVGDTVDVTINDRTLPLRVVGSAVLNDAIGAQQSPGEGIVVTIDQLRTFVGADDLEANGYLVRLAPGVDRAQAYARLRDEFGPTVRRPQLPLEVEVVRSVREVPITLAAMVGVAAALLLAYALVANVRHSRRELALLKALGATRAQVGRVVAWQATIATGVAVVVGLPVGVIAGRQLWRWADTSFGTTLSPSIPVAILALVTVGAIALSLAVTMLPARMGSRTPAAVVLRSE
jgi:hypothetical protein